MAGLPDRKKAEALWRKYNDDQALWKHALAVEAAMRHFASLKGGNADEWGITGLIHDLDYQRFSDEHCVKVRELLEAEGWPEHIIRAVQSHGWTICSDVEPLSDMEKTLFAIDELTGFISACALVRPSKSVIDLEVKSVRKKWKDSAFAAKVNRQVVNKGIDMLGMAFDDVVNEVILSMRKIHKELGL